MSLLKRHQQTLLLGLIIIVAAVVQLYALDRADLITDEASINVRAIGYLDFLATPFQTTPLEWLQTWPWWINISFHDLPAFFFVVQHLMFSWFGTSVLVMRLIPALAGIGAVALIYLLAKKLFSPQVGLLAAALLAVNDYHIWISRMALQESLVIFLSLGAIYLALIAGNKPRYWYLFALITGLAIMTKIHAIIILPLVGSYLFLVPRQSWRQKEWYLSWLIILIVCSPYIVYNLIMYHLFGHFDFQFSYLFHQSVAVWQVRPGREEFPTLASSFRFFFLNLKDAFSPLLSAALVGIIVSLGFAWKKFSSHDKSGLLLIGLAGVWYFLLFMAIGPSWRFLTLSIPWIILIIAYGLRRLLQLNRWYLWLVLILAISYELLFGLATTITYAHIGSEGWGYSRIKYLEYAYGYRQLESEIDYLLKDKKPAVTLPIQNANLQNFVQTRVLREQGVSSPIMIIYDPRLYGEEVYWALTSRLIYQGWPVVSYGIYSEALQSQGKDFFLRQGISQFYFIEATDSALQSQVTPESLQAVKSFIEVMKTSAHLEKEITNHQGQVVFRMYSFSSL